MALRNTGNGIGNVKYPSLISPYTFREGYDYKKYLEEQRHFDDLAADIDQSIAKLALSNTEVARLSTEVIVESQREAASQMNQELDSIRVGIERLDDTIVDLRQSVQDVRWAIDEVRYSIESGFQLTAQRLSVIDDVLRDLLEAVKSPEKTWALEKYDIANDLYRRELYEDALSYLNDALHGHGDHRGYIFDPRVHMLKGNILLGDVKNFEPNLIDLAAAKKCFDEAVKYAKPSRDMLAGADGARQEELFQPRVFARCSSAWASYVQGDMALAEKEYREAVKEGPNDARANYYLGKVLSHQGKFDEAESALDKAIRVNFFYIAKLATDQDYLKDRKRCERKVSNYREELLQRLKPFADVLCLLRGRKAVSLLSEWLKQGDVSWRYNAIQNFDLAHAIANKSAEIGPIVSNYDQLKRDALQAQTLIEEAVKMFESRLSSAQSRKRCIMKPTERHVGRCTRRRDDIQTGHNLLGCFPALVLCLLGFILQSHVLLVCCIVAAVYGTLGAFVIAEIAEKGLRSRAFKRLEYEYRIKISKADEDISYASARSRDAKEILAQLQRLAPKLTNAPE